MNEKLKAVTPNTTDATTWKDVLPELIALLVEPTAEAHTTAMTELRRMAQLADRYVGRFEALQAALQSAQNTLTAVEILLKNQDRREHEEKVYDAVRACAGIVRVALEKDTGAHE